MVMKWFSKVLIILLLSGLILIPPLLTGFYYLSQAETNSNALQASRAYETAAKFLFWRPDLYEKAGLLAGDEPQRAVYFFNLARNQKALSTSGQVALGDAYLALGQFDLARNEWEFLFTHNLEITSIGPRLTLIYHQQNDYQKEEKLLKSWLDRDPTNPVANERLGTLLSANASPEALAYLLAATKNSSNQALKLDPLIAALQSTPDNQAYRLVRCGQALANLSEWNLAERAFNNAVTKENRYADAWAWLGLARQHENMPGALQALEYAIQIAPTAAAIHAMLGTYWLQTGNSKEARQQFLIATQLEPANPAWWVGNANSASRLDLPDALNSYTQAVNLAPVEAKYWYALAAFCVENNVYIEDYGLNAALRAYAIDPTNPTYMDMLGRAQLAIGQSLAAEIMFKQALEADKTNTQAYIYHFHLGLLYLQTNQASLAKFELSQTVASDPIGGYASQAKKLIERYFP